MLAEEGSYNDYANHAKQSCDLVIFRKRENGQSKNEIAVHGHTRVVLHSCAL